MLTLLYALLYVKIYPIKTIISLYQNRDESFDSAGLYRDRTISLLKLCKISNRVKYFVLNFAFLLICFST